MNSRPLYQASNWRAKSLLKSPHISVDPRNQKYAQLIRDQNQRLNDQIEKFLSLAKMEKDQFELNKESIDLNDFIEKIITSVDLKVQKLSGTLQVNLKATSSWIQADKLHLANVLTNLLDNAIKYTKQAPHVEISTRNEGERIICEVSDSGIGIDEEHVKKIFDKFYRVPTGNIHDVKGFGLGLFYVKNVCDAHGWHLGIKSKPGQGTSMRITI